MRVITLLALCVVLLAPFANAQIPPAQSTVATMDDPSENWFIVKTGNGAYIYDGVSGENGHIGAVCGDGARLGGGQATGDGLWAAPQHPFVYARGDYFERQVEAGEQIAAARGGGGEDEHERNREPTSPRFQVPGSEFSRCMGRGG